MYVVVLCKTDVHLSERIIFRGNRRRTARGKRRRKPARKEHREREREELNDRRYGVKKTGSERTKKCRRKKKRSKKVNKKKKNEQEKRSPETGQNGKEERTVVVGEEGGTVPNKREGLRFHESDQTSGGLLGVPRGLLTVRKQ